VSATGAGCSGDLAGVLERRGPPVQHPVGMITGPRSAAWRNWPSDTLVPKRRFQSTSPLPAHPATNGGVPLRWLVGRKQNLVAEALARLSDREGKATPRVPFEVLL
jgi:hypothetical protein